MNNRMFRFKKSLRKHAPVICTTAGVASMVVGVVLAVKKTPEAMEKLESADISEDSTKKERAVETVKATWKCYVPAAICEIAGATLIFGSTRVYSNRYAALSNMLCVSETAYKNLQDKMEEKLTKKQVNEIKDSLAEDEIKENPPENSTIIITDKGNHLFFDSMTGQYFRSSFEEVHRVINEINARINAEYYVQNNELILSWGETPCKTFEKLTWSSGEQIDVRESNATINGEAVTSLSYNIGSFDV